ncbi:MAG TPA: hypothetical protein VGK48_22810 [Terriglobia bacterium]|jgi:hypothetical protein
MPTHTKEPAGTLVETLIIPSTGSSITTCCRCGRTWNVVMERVKPGTPGCLRCICDTELISWSGSVIFSAFPAETN